MSTPGGQSDATCASRSSSQVNRSSAMTEPVTQKAETQESSTISKKRRYRVVKLGGSLLDLPDLGERLKHWRASHLSRCDVVIVGGGPRVDHLREEQLAHGMDDETAHWRAIDIMGENSEALAKRITAHVTRDFSELAIGISVVLRRRAYSEKEDETSLPVILNPVQYMEMWRKAAALPCNWDTTSDSIAAFIATKIRFDEVTLLKSALPEPKMTLEELSACGYVDRQFPTAAAGIPSIRFVDFRSEEFHEAWACRP